MTKAKYANRRHKGLRAKWAAVVASGRAECMEAVCLMSSRFIAPGTPWDLAHTPDGRGYLGPAHARCNRAEGARRGNAMRVMQPRRREL